MANIESRLATLEQLQRNARPALVIFSRLGRQSPEQAAQIEQAELEGREVKIRLASLRRPSAVSHNQAAARDSPAVFVSAL